MSPGEGKQPWLITTGLEALSLCFRSGFLIDRTGVLIAHKDRRPRQKTGACRDGCTSTFSISHPMAPWGLDVLWGRLLALLSVLLTAPLPHHGLCGQWTARLWGFVRLGPLGHTHHCYFSSSLETAGRSSRQFLQCFWSRVFPAPQIFNHQTFFWEWVFPVHSIPAEPGPINTSALCCRVYLAGKWVLPCKQEAPWSYYLQMQLKSHMFMFMGFKNSLNSKAKEEVGEPFSSQWEQGLQTFMSWFFTPSGNGYLTIVTQPRATAEMELLACLI